MQGELKTQEMGKPPPPQVCAGSQSSLVSQQSGCGHGRGGSGWGEMVLHAVLNRRNMAYWIGKKDHKYIHIYIFKG